MIDILYEDDDILVCIKPAGTLSELSEAQNSLPKMLKEEGRADIFTVHRLDREVTGVMVYAKTQIAAARLSRDIGEGKLEKIYLAMTEGRITEPAGRLCDLLFKDAKKNKSYVVKRERRGVKKASLEYVELHADERGTLYRIKLHTGRTHQIRVQFSSRACPIIGDRKYGASAGGKIHLASHIIGFTHPRTNKEMRFEYVPDFAKREE